MRYKDPRTGLEMGCEVVDALVPALAQLTEEGVRPTELLKDTAALRKKLCQVMSDHWSGLHGIEVLLFRDRIHPNAGR